jgi:hypothetical protein
MWSRVWRSRVMSQERYGGMRTCLSLVVVVVIGERLSGRRSGSGWKREAELVLDARQSGGG